MTEYSGENDPIEDAKMKAKTIAAMIVLGFGNICAVSSAYVGFKYQFAMPLTAKVVMTFFIFWLIITLISHKVIRPFLEKRFLKKVELGQAGS